MPWTGLERQEIAVAASDLQSPDNALVDAVRLSLVSGVGPRIRRVLLERFGDAETALRASKSELMSLPGIGAKLSREISAARGEIDVQPIFELCTEHGISMLSETSGDLPLLLCEIDDPPGMLYCRGAFTQRDAISVAIVGTRHATPYGLAQAERLAGGLARAGVTIVSGLARGIDAAAHRGALKASGRTIAVLGSGLLNIYPPEHKQLAEDVIQSGALVSEMHPLSPPLSGSFPQRNRLITGMSLGVVVVEAAERSGALISARHAMEQGREVFAVPGRIDNRVSRGCHQLIRDGAKLVQDVNDVLEELGPLVAPAQRPDGGEVKHVAELSLNDQERSVLETVGDDPTSIDEVIRATGLPAHRVLSTVSVLEQRGVLRRVSGNYVARR